jgi:hypothetical protein
MIVEYAFGMHCIRNALHSECIAFGMHCIRNALHSSFLLLEWMQLRKIKSKTDLFYPCYLLHLFTNARNFNPYLRSFLRYLHFILFIHYFAVEVLIIIISFTVILQDPTHLQRQVIVWWLRICQVQYLGR